MKTLTVETIRSYEPCYDPTRYLPEDWQGNVIDLLDQKQIPFKDRLWVILRDDLVSAKLMRLFAVWCARQAEHLMTDERSIKALDVSERYALGQAARDELDVARAAAWAAAGDAAEAAAWDVARAAAWAAWSAAEAAAWDVARAAAGAGAAAGDAAEAGAWDVARAAAEAAAWDVARAAAWAAWSAAAAAAWDVARAAAWAAWSAAEAGATARAAQEAKFREMLIEGVETGGVL